VSARKIALLILLIVFGATIETAWSVRNEVALGPEGCRVMSGRFYGPSWTFEQSAQRSVASAAPRLEIANRFGSVKVSAGAAGTVKVKLRKVVFQPTEEKARAFADRIELRLAGEGQPLRIGTNRDELERSEHVGFETHLEIEAPAESVLAVRNEHGRVDVAGLAAADVGSSFDAVSVERLSGDLKLDSRHGDVSVADVGSVTLRSRFGNVEVSGTRGPSRVDVEHGDLRTRQTAAVDARQQYGNVTADGVNGELVVRASHADLRASDVVGRVDVETSFGGVHLSRVGGAARARVEHGGFTAEDVTGGVDAKTSYEGIRLANVGGLVEATANRGEVHATSLAQGGRLEGEHGDVSVDGFAGPLAVAVRQASATIDPRAALAAALSVDVTHGDVRLSLPEGSRVSLDVTSARGEVHSELPGLAPSADGGGEHGRGHRLSGAIGGGGANVTVRADGDVTLESHAATALAEQPIAKPAATPTSTPTPAPTPSASARAKRPQSPAEAPAQ
jgi:hypothetical protein